MIDDPRQSPAPSPRVARKREARIQQILATALDLARDEGREALTLQRLAQRLTLTPAALYRYFPSKDALIAELQRAVIADLAATTRARAVAAEAHGMGVGLDRADRALLGVVVTALSYEHFARTRPVEFGLISMFLSTPEFALPDREAARVFATAWQSLQGLATQLAAAADAGALAVEDASDRAVALWAGLQGVAQTRKLARSAAGRIDPGRIARNLVRSLLVGWGADSNQVDRILCSVEQQAFFASDPAASPIRAAV